MNTVVWSGLGFYCLIVSFSPVQKTCFAWTEFSILSYEVKTQMFGFFNSYGTFLRKLSLEYLDNNLIILTIKALLFLLLKILDRFSPLKCLCNVMYFCYLDKKISLEHSSCTLIEVV